VAQAVDAERLLGFGRDASPQFPLHLDESLPLPAEERLVWERRLNGYRHSCGCAEGAAGLCAGLLLALIVYFLKRGHVTKSDIAVMVGLPIVLLVAGKLIGRLLDRRRFLKACKQLLSRLAVNA
jgi:hypothetical protein